MNYLIAMLLSIIAIGCGTVADTAYKTSATTHVAAKAALIAWNDYIGTHKVTAAQETEVQSAWLKYTDAQQALLEAAELFKLGQDKDFTALASALGNAEADIVALIRKYGVKI